MDPPGILIFHIPEGKYVVTDFINEGTYGTVWKGRDLAYDPAEPRSCIAIKKIHDFCAQQRYPDGTDVQHRFLKKVYRELLVMRLFSGCPEFMPLRDLYTDPAERDLYLVMDYKPLSLRDVLQQKGVAGLGLTEGAVRYMAFQLLHGIARMARYNTIHRDLAPANILTDLQSCNVAITDFGLVRAFFKEEDTLSLDVVTLPYRPPELLMLSPVTDNKIDVWSVGIVLVELLLGDSFIHAKDQVATFKLIVMRVADIPSLAQWRGKAGKTVLDYLTRNWAEVQSMEKTTLRAILERRLDETGERAVSDAAIDVLEAMLQVYPTDRLSAEQALAMPWFQDEEVQGGLRRLQEYEPRAVDHALLRDAENLTSAEMRSRVLTLTGGLRGTTAYELEYTSGKHQ